MNWQAAQVDYPSELTVGVGDTATYVAAVDTRDTPAPPETAIPVPSATAERVFVQCEIAARLIPVDDGLTVDSEGDSDGWTVRSFTPAGLIRWSWTVTAAEAGEGDLRLDLQPAVRSDDGRVLVSDSATEISSFFTHTLTTQSAFQRMGTWWRDNWGTVTLVAAGLGTAVLAVLRYGATLAEQLRTFWTAVRGGGAARRPGGSADEDGGEHTITIARVYDEPSGSGRRFLVERRVPTGVHRASLGLDDSPREVAPSTQLRRWFGNDPRRWEEFRQRYLAELDARPEAWRPLLAAARSGDIVLLYAAGDDEHNSALVLRNYLLARMALVQED